MLELKRKELEFKDYDGNLVKLNFPTAKDLMEFGKKANDIVLGKLDMSEHELAKELLLKCNMKEELIDSLYYDHLVQIIEELKGVKKN